MLYVVRHGETSWNVNEVICGRFDATLTELGEQQAQELGREMARKNLTFSRVLSSPLVRAKRTAEIALYEKRKSEDAVNQTSLYFTNTAQADSVLRSIEIDSRLQEMDFGEIEGFSRFDETYLFYRRQFAARFPGGESLFDVVQRVYSLLDELKTEQGDVLLVCHGCVCRVIHSYFVSLTNEELDQWQASNAMLYSYEW